MEQWSRTSEPYIKVQERIKTAALNTTAGEDLVIGAVIISDAGPSTPQLITSQKEFLSYYASEEISENYFDKLNGLYGDGTTNIASTMWANAYRLAGSNSLLCVRASKADNLYYAKPIDGTTGSYVIRDGELLKKSTSFKIDINLAGDNADNDSDGWAIAVNGIGVFGNRVTDGGAQYDYKVDTLPELIDELNKTSKFFCPKYKYYTTHDVTTSTASVSADTNNIVSVVLEEVYIAADFIDTEDDRLTYHYWKEETSLSDSSLTQGTTADFNPVLTSLNSDGILSAKYNTNLDGKYYTATDNSKYYSIDSKNNGTKYLVICTTTSTSANQVVIDLNNSASYGNFSADVPLAINNTNTANELKIRVRRFNHLAVTSRSITDETKSPWSVLINVLDNNITTPATQAFINEDFYEFTIWDATVNDGKPLYFNVGNNTGRGDITLDELNNNYSTFTLSLNKIDDLKLNYYDYSADNSSSTNPNTEISVNVNITNSDMSILKISEEDLKRSIDLIAEDETYVVEGITDLGNTEISYQNYLSTLAINSNYFYPVSTLNSTNYMVIGNRINKLAQDSCKLYNMAPWDIDTTTLGFIFYVSPSVLYWETVARNRRNNNEFAAILGPENGYVKYANPVINFNKKVREMLLTKKVNTPIWNITSQTYDMNDNVTAQKENNILSDEANSRLHIRISKLIPIILHQFIGKRINEKLCSDVEDSIEYSFNTTILSMNYSISDFKVTCEYDEVLARQNKIKVVVSVRYMRALKYVEVYNDAYDVGVDFGE